MAKIALEILSPERALFSGEVDEVIGPGADGLFGVRPSHAPMLVATEGGNLTFRVEGKVRSCRIGPGLLEVGREHFCAMVDSGELL